MFEFGQVFHHKKVENTTGMKFLTEVTNSPNNKKGRKSSLSPLRQDTIGDKKIKVEGFEGKVGQIYFLEEDKFERIHNHIIDKSKM